MKKIIAILLILSISISICACGQGKTDSIELTVYNISQYLYVNVRPFTEDGEDRAKVEIYPTQPGSFANTKVSLRITPDGATRITEIIGAKYEVRKESAYSNNEYVVVDITLPANGTFEFDIDFGYHTASPIKYCNFHLVSGEFYPQ